MFPRRPMIVDKFQKENPNITIDTRLMFFYLADDDFLLKKVRDSLSTGGEAIPDLVFMFDYDHSWGKAWQEAVHRNQSRGIIEKIMWITTPPQREAPALKQAFRRPCRQHLPGATGHLTALHPPRTDYGFQPSAERAKRRSARRLGGGNVIRSSPAPAACRRSRMVLRFDRIWLVASISGA